MNKTFEEADELIFNICELVKLRDTDTTQVIVCPPYPYLELAQDLGNEAGIFIGAQNMSEFASGAYTGEISAEMLASMHIDYCIIGHSERRKYFHENNAVIGSKVQLALKNGINPIFCCGETKEEREKSVHFEIVKKQLDESIFNLDEGDFSNVVIAYEPVWAIGTGLNATPAQAQEMHAFIREQVEKRYNKDISENVIILYGGSCNPKNAAELFANPDVDGGLIGGASLNAEDFLKIIEAAG